LSDSDSIKLEEVIHDMLYKYDCVVIPGFGGFVSQYLGAQILTDKNLILPPSKSLIFNALLKKNDGLVAQEIVLKYKITYQEALNVIELQVDQWLIVLSSSKRITISGVGSLMSNKKGAIIFTQNLKTNFLNDAYGLAVIKAQVLKKEGISGKIKEEFVQRQASPSFNKNVKKIVSGGALAAAILVMFVWSYINIDVVQRQAESLGLFFTTAEDVIPTPIEDSAINEGIIDAPILITNKTTDSSNLHDSIIETSSVLTEDIYVTDLPDDEILGVREINTNQEKEEAKIDNTEVHSETTEALGHDAYQGKYVVVAGCFRSLHNATNFVNNLKSLGYEAHLSGKSEKGLHMVAYGSYNNRSDALKSMRWIQSTHNAQAWMTTR
jgi:cell division septation protein DedD/nucleoid DNA-binding protein